MDKRRIIFAGAASIYGIDDFLEIMAGLDINIRFIENQTMSEKIEPGLRYLVEVCEHIPDDCDVFIPLNEYWVTEYEKFHYVLGLTNISDTALSASRSKQFLSDILKANGVPYVERCPVSDVMGHFKEDFLIRVDAGYSGYGIARSVELSIMDQKEIRKLIEARISDGMKSILDRKDCVLVCEKFMHGNEYSVDVLKVGDTIGVVRVCQKYVVWIDNIPCALGYMIIPNPDRFSTYIENWVRAIFAKEDISFAQFDFVESNDGFLPLDFSCRIGSGIAGLLKHAFKKNIYATVFRDILQNTKKNSYCDKYMCQYNVVSNSVGVLKSIEICWPRDHVAYHRKTAGMAISYHLGSANCRLAEIIDCVESDSVFDETCKNISNYVVVTIDDFNV